MLPKHTKRDRRHKRVTSKIIGTAARPRLCVFRSAKHVSAQLINDENGKTLVAASTEKQAAAKAPVQEKSATRKVTEAYAVGQLLAEKAQKKGITRVVFDRAGYQYHGRVKAIAEGARKGGLTF